MRLYSRSFPVYEWCDLRFTTKIIGSLNRNLNTSPHWLWKLFKLTFTFVPQFQKECTWSKLLLGMVLTRHLRGSGKVRRFHRKLLNRYTISFKLFRKLKIKFISILIVGTYLIFFNTWPPTNRKICKNLQRTKAWLIIF